MRTRVWAMAAVALLLTARAHAEPLVGRWRETADPSVVLVLRESADGLLTGTLGGDPPLPVRARATTRGLEGTLALAPDHQLPFVATRSGDRLELCVTAPDEADCAVFQREASAAVAPVPATGGARVVINGKQLSADEVARIERAHGLRVPAASYWYDPVCGAWGAQGGPTAGFLAPGLPFPGPLRADASGTGTRVFINGREAHPLDVRALAGLVGTPILPGRYFLTAHGLAGFEGGPPLWNLLALASTPAGGGSNTWSSLLSSGFSDASNENGAVFLPGGGIVTYGN